ncbi:coiled-coil domain-containing protein 17-like [Antennarius striatus]|uniref:coiled-coil domain-containing protein 17-like n=1 Tax=Antennarius striatus TaxID=241820 RepID=UPI0035B35A02
MERKLICSDCDMVFHSTGLLHKHKTLFCVWGEIGQLQVHNSEEFLPDKPGCTDPTTTRTPEPQVQLRGQRRNTTGGRNVDAKPKSARAEDEPTAGQTGSAALQDLTDEFHKLRMSIEENLPNWSNRTGSAEARGNGLRRAERMEEMKDMATLHEHQLALIHAKGQQLEQQREELAHQVSILSEQSSTIHLENLLEELREQEQRNEETLRQLVEHLHVLQALGTVYVESGGSDPAILAQMIELQVEAQSLEKKKPASAGDQATLPLSQELLVVEQENRRLEEEIFWIQLARERRHNSEAVMSQLEHIQRDNLLQIYSLQAEMERTTAALRPRGPPLPPPPPPHLLPLQTKTYAHAPRSLLQAGSFSALGVSRMVDPLGPAPYDPAAGFVVFYDLVLGLDVVHKALRLVAGLYKDGQQVEQLSPLPPVHCLPGVILPYPHSLTSRNAAVLSVRHPIPRVQPSPSLSLVVEVQAAEDPDFQIHQVLKLESCGWTRLELFDQYNQLRSGHWRAPVRSLPVRPSLNQAQLNSVAQLGNMELCVRLVNGRDGDVQTLALPDPSSSSRYEYPPAAGC